LVWFIGGALATYLRERYKGGGGLLFKWNGNEDFHKTRKRTATY